MERSPALTEVVVTAADHPTGLGTARALAAPDVSLTGLCHSLTAPCSRSRVWRRLVAVPAGSATAALEALLSLGRAAGGPRVLFPADDGSVELVSRHRDELAPYFRFVLPAPEIVEQLLNKTEFHLWASQRGFPVPETHIAETDAGLAAVLRDIRYPVVLKPLWRTPAWETKSPNHKAYRLLRPEDLGQLGFSPFEAAPKFVVQRWIEGGDDDVHFCLTYVNAQGEELGFFAGRKYLQWPPQTGSTAICVGETNEALLDLTRSLWRETGFKGIGSLEAKFCAAERKYYITEPTVGRNNLQSYVAVAGGVNLSRIALRDALGLPAPARVRPRGAVWINEPFALLALREAFARRKPERRTLRGLLTAFRRVGFAYFAIADPRPWLNLVWLQLRRLGAGASSA